MDDRTPRRGNLDLQQCPPRPHDCGRRKSRSLPRLRLHLDVLLPIVDLGQEKAWRPLGAAQYRAWALTGLGWVLTTAVVAGLTRVLRRD